MDLDAFVTEHQGEWHRLRQLAGRSKRRMSGVEVEEMLALYQRAATHLSIVRSRSADPALVAWLSRLVQQARTSLTPSPGFTFAGVLRFFTVTLPVELYRSALWWLAVAAGFVALAGIRMAVVADDPTRFVSAAQIEYIASEGFEAYYSEFAPYNFTFLVWVNNAWIAAICLAGGILIVPVLLALWYNMDNVGVVGGVMLSQDRGDLFFGLILIHGLLELTAIFIAAGVGLRIGWAWIAPGDGRTRGQALAERARSGMVVALGLVLVLLISGFVEGFVTPAPVPIPAKLALGALVWAGFLAYLIGFGRYAVQARESADVDSLDRPVYAPAT